MAEKTFGTFEKDGRVVTAYSAKRAVQLRYDGWAETSKRDTKAPSPKSSDKS